MRVTFNVKRVAAIGSAALLTGCAAASGISGNSGSTTSANPRPRFSPPGHPLAHDCVVTAKLIPTCGAWWGVAPEVFTGHRPSRAVARTEERMGRPADIVHVYHRGGELFPTPEERALAAGPRLLLINWKPSLRHTWAEIASGAVDRRIDALAAYILRTFPGRFFLTIHHEPEDDVAAAPGRSAEDYANMFRHVVTRLRAQGVRNAVTVMTYMGAPNWSSKPWFERLYPGDDVVDWIGLDPYADGRVADFAGLVDKTRPDHPEWPGFYRWAQSRFPAKPIMVAEWGAFERQDHPRFKPDFYRSVRAQIRAYPQIKALVYFDSPWAPRGDTRFDTTPAAATAFTALATDSHFSVTKVPAG
ncbi:glycoside hydrolase family 26 protein [Acrocarpospora catenulata]|uniref:glycoside hydrolase family 26 protein n=1 Tax=Acrocarpospora catenulata TaxID=2836182 RepID=UPI001BD93842|nr:glycosyl hydrolase [Acrocarpospora catenulata]